MNQREINMAAVLRYRIIFCIVLAEYLVFIFSQVSFASLAGNRFFSLEADPVFWLFYLAGAPQYILQHQWLGIVLDFIIILCLLLIIRKPKIRIISMVLFTLLLLYYVTLMGHLTHRNYQAGFFIVFIPFLFRRKTNKDFAFEALRYYLLFFYFSAACLKIFGGTILDTTHLSSMLSGQFTPYFLEGNTGIRTNLNMYLVNHPILAYILYIASLIIELVMVIGFFTKRFDRTLAIMLLIFHVANWLIMDIAPFGQIAFISILFVSASFSIKKSTPIPSN